MVKKGLKTPSRRIRVPVQVNTIGVQETVCNALPSQIEMSNTITALGNPSTTATLSANKFDPAALMNAGSSLDSNVKIGLALLAVYMIYIFYLR